MSKNKRPSPKKSSEKSAEPDEAKDDALIQRLCDLAIDLVEQEDGESMSGTLQQQDNDFRKLIRKCLHQKKDAVLYEAIERAQDADSEAWQFLKDSIEEASSTVLLRRGESMIEVNAFVVPLFVHSRGGLKHEQCFQDPDAFDLLVKSFKEAQLESADAKVVLVSHAYHPDEIDRITYCHLNEMVMDAFTSMTDKKIVATPAIGRSLSGWPDNLFEADDEAIELRFLLGFALKTTDDAFYHVPDDEAGADAYFAAREERFQKWTVQAASLVRRCLAIGPESEINFLYQDLFHGGKETGIAEYFMLQMMSELNRDLHEHDATPAETKAIIGPAEVGDGMVLRVNLYAADGTMVASSDKPLGAAGDLQMEIADVHDALTTIGVEALSLAMQFDGDGKPVDVRPFED